jgi:predicted metal-dependent hydrolase
MVIRWTTKKKKRNAKPIERRESFDIDGRSVEVSLRANPRARRYIVKVDPTTGEVLVTAPSFRSLSDALAFAKKEKNWIADMLAHVPEPIELKLGAPILYGGVVHVLLRADMPAREARRGPVWIDDDALLPTICVAGRDEHIARRTRDWLKAEARRNIGERVTEFSRALEVRAKRVTIRDTTSRWGSCSSHDYLSFSWRLIMAPPYVLDYVVAHEVAHLRELNHEPRFWRLVDGLVQHRKRSQAWLDEHGAMLYQYAPRARKS